VEVDATTLRFDERGIADPLIGSVHDPIYQGAGAYGVAGIPQPKPGAVTKAHGGILFFGRNRRASSDTDEQAAEGFGRQGCLFGKVRITVPRTKIFLLIYMRYSKKDCLRISDLWAQQPERRMKSLRQ